VSSAGNAARLAQHFTPPAVAQFAWEAVRALAGKDLESGSRVIDPAAGEGALLEVVDRAFRTTGIEIDARLAERGGSAADRFNTGDGLLGAFPQVVEGHFDCVLANPPFGKIRSLLPLLGQDWEILLGQRFKLIGIKAVKHLDSFPVELLFVERALQLVRPSGWLALILPESFFANAHLQIARDWLLQRAEVRTVVALPSAAFRSKGLNAHTALVVMRRREVRRRSKARLIAPTAQNQDLDLYLQDALQLLKAPARKQDGAKLVSLSQRELSTRRWDPRYWQGYEALRELAGRLQLVSLGDYIRHLTYGPIVTGSRPGHVDAGVPVIRQGDIVETGLDEGDLLCVQPQGRHDPLRSRVCCGDLLLPRSGTGALGQNRLAVYLGRGPANVGCFVDLIRLEGLNPFYAWFFFKTRPGREQIAAHANGVGTPNISFGEIRSLQIAALSKTHQQELEGRYHREVWPLHRRRREDEAIRLEGEYRFRAIVDDLERYLEGAKWRLVSRYRPH